MVPIWEPLSSDWRSEPVHVVFNELTINREDAFQGWKFDGNCGLIHKVFIHQMVNDVRITNAWTVVSHLIHLGDHNDQWELVPEHGEKFIPWHHVGITILIGELDV